MEEPYSVAQPGQRPKRKRPVFRNEATFNLIWTMKTAAKSFRFFLALVTWQIIGLGWHNLVALTVAPSSAVPDVVTNTNDDGSGSLRNAIRWANLHPGGTVRFNFPANLAAGGLFTIQPLSELPVLTANGTIINGATQPGYAGVPLVIVNGSAAGTGAVGLRVSTSNCTVRGVAINGFDNDGLQIYGAAAASNKVEACYLGLSGSGLTANANAGNGIAIFDGAHHNVIGGTNASVRNVLSGNDFHGVFIGGSGTSSNWVAGNFLGTDVTGTAAIPNGSEGVVVLDGAQGNFIGGTNAASRNVISGNMYSGVWIGGVGASFNQVQGNFIGTDLTGATALANGSEGVILISGAQSNLIGGTNAAARNIISGNAAAGVFISGDGTSYNLIQGNYIGTTASGALALANHSEGVVILDGAQGNWIGGSIAGAKNLISGNDRDGVYLADAATSGNLVQGNFIGTGLGGTDALGNGIGGVTILGGAQGNFIGGAEPGARNLISGNAYRGLWIGDFNTTSNVIQGNFIGTDVTGNFSIGHFYEGILLINGASRNTIGLQADGSGSGNRIAFNDSSGVLLYDANCTGNSIRGNEIFSNGQLGINLFGGSENAYGVTANDAGDADAGANGLQNFPVLTNVAVSGSSTTVRGTLNSTAHRTFRIEFFRSFAANSSGNGEGAVSLGSVNSTTDSSGNSSFSFGAAGAFTGQYFSAAATDFVTGDTSEFSFARLPVNAPAGAPNITTAPQNQTVNRGSNVTFSVVANGNPTLRYQWRLNGTNLTGANNSSLTLPNVQLNQAGTYSVTVSNSVALTASPEASLVVLNGSLTRPILAGPYIYGAASFSMNLTLESGRNYRVQASTDFGSWIDLTNFVSGGTSFQFSDPATAAFPYRFYRITSP